MRTTRVTFVALAILLSCQAVSAEGKVHPLSIVGAKATPLTTAGATVHFGCELRSFADPNVWCYGPEAIRAVYSLKNLLANGITGKGQTIVIIDAFGSPTVEADLAQFDTVFGIPAPPSIKQIHMPGSTPFDYTDDNQLGWAQEVSLDVQWAHAIAPGAKIVVVAAINNSDWAILDVQNYAIDHKLGFIIPESFGESEYALLQDAEGRKTLRDNERSYRRARREHISVLVSAGDDGASTTDINGDLVPFAAPDYPASSPNVTHRRRHQPVFRDRDQRRSERHLPERSGLERRFRRRRRRHQRHVQASRLPRGRVVQGGPEVPERFPQLSRRRLQRRRQGWRPASI